jgi:DNA-binding transcriptional ArsR family regulator
VTLTIHFTAEDLARVRVVRGPDPMWEMLLSLHLLQSGDGAVVFGPWKKRVRRRLRETVELVPWLAPPVGYSPDFLTPAGGGVDAVLSTPRHRLGTDLGRLASTRPVPDWVGRLARGERAALDRLGTDLHAYHRLALAPHWDHIRSRVDADRAVRAGHVLDGGSERLLERLHPDVRWEPPALRVRYGGGDRELRLDGRGLLLVPSFFCWHDPITLLDPELPPVLVYPVERELGWHDPGDRPGHRTLTALLGRTRAVVLESVADRCTTGELARRLGISPASASEHATVLRAAGLVTTSRDRNMSRHALTALGRAVLDGGTQGGVPVTAPF